MGNRIKLEKIALDTLLDCGINNPNSPYTKVDGKTYCTFDDMRIQVLDGHITLQFFWQGKLYAVLSILHEPGQIAYFSGFKVAVEVMVH